MKLKIWELSLFAALVIALLWATLLEQQQVALSEQLIRLHVVAHSDEATQQALKLSVRDKVQAYVEPLLAGAETRAEAKAEIEANLPEIQAAAAAAVAAWGYQSPVQAHLAFASFPTRAYESFTLPAGRYHSLQIEIGQAAGQNWWCVVFPPLCIESVSGPQALEVAGLTDAEISLISGDTSGHVVRFRTLELFNGLRDFFGQ